MKKVLCIAAVAAVIAFAILVLCRQWQAPAGRAGGPALSMGSTLVCGQDLTVNVAIKNEKGVAVEMPYCEDSRSLISWVYRNRDNIKLTKDGATVPLQPMPENIESFAKMHDATQAVAPGGSVAYSVDLRKVFDLPMAEAGVYKLDMLGSTYTFTVAAETNIVLSSADSKGEIEYAVLACPEGSKLVTRIKGQLFQDVGRLAISPLAMGNYALFNVPWCPKGQIVCFATSNALHVLPPEQATPGSRAELTPVEIQCHGIKKLGELTVSKDFKDNHSDLTLSVTVANGEQKSVRMRLKNRTVTTLDKIPPR